MVKKWLRKGRKPPVRPDPTDSLRGNDLRDNQFGSSPIRRPADYRTHCIGQRTLSVHIISNETTKSKPPKRRPAEQPSPMRHSHKEDGIKPQESLSRVSELHARRQHDGSSGCIVACMRGRPNHATFTTQSSSRGYD